MNPASRRDLNVRARRGGSETGARCAGRSWARAKFGSEGVSPAGKPQGDRASSWARRTGNPLPVPAPPRPFRSSVMDATRRERALQTPLPRPGAYSGGRGGPGGVPRGGGRRREGGGPGRAARWLLRQPGEGGARAAAAHNGTPAAPGLSTGSLTPYPRRRRRPRRDTPRSRRRLEWGALALERQGVNMQVTGEIRPRKGETSG